MTDADQDTFSPFKEGHGDKRNATALLAKALDVEIDAIKNRFHYEKDEEEHIFSLFTEAGNAFAIVILTRIELFGSSEQKLKSVLEKSTTAGVGVIVDIKSSEKRWIRRRFDRAEFEYIADYRLLAGGRKFGEA